MTLTLVNTRLSEINASLTLEPSGGVSAEPSAVVKTLAPGEKFSAQIKLLYEGSQAGARGGLYKKRAGEDRSRGACQTRARLYPKHRRAGKGCFPVVKRRMASLLCLSCWTAAPRAGEISLASAGNYFVFRAVLRDDAPKPEKIMHDGSGIELFFANEGGKIRQLFAAPDFAKTQSRIYYANLNFFPAGRLFAGDR